MELHFQPFQMTLFLGGREEGGGGIRGRTFQELPLSKVAFTQYAAGFVSTSKNSVLFLLIDTYFFSAICDERAGSQWGQ